MVGGLEQGGFLCSSVPSFVVLYTAIVRFAEGVPSVPLSPRLDE